MKYNYKTLKEELIKNELADDGLVALGQNISTAAIWFGAIGAAIAGSKNTPFTVSMVGEKIVIIPYDKNGQYFDKTEAYAKEDIKALKLGGFIYKVLKITTKDDKVHKYTILQGVKDVKAMLEKLALPKK